MSYVSNLHSLPRPIYLCRHGQSEYNLDERLGGDPPITDKVRFELFILFYFFLEIVHVFFSDRGNTMRSI